MGAPVVNHSELIKLGIIHFEAKQPLLILGQPGIGKTWLVVNEIPKYVAGNRKVVVYPIPLGMMEKILEKPEKYFLVIPFHLSMVSIEDLIGVPFRYMIDRNGKKLSFVAWEPNPIVKLLSLPKIAGILFLDELFQADETKQAVALRLVLEKALVDVRLSDEVWVVGASNRLSDVAGTNMPISPLLDRFSVFVLRPPTAEEWVENFAMKRDDIHELVISFLSHPSFSKYINTFDPEMFMANPESPYATPRSWHKAGYLLKLAEEKYGKSEDFFKLARHIIASLCGEGIATEFMEYIRVTDIPKPDDIVRDPNILDKYVDDADKMYAIVKGLADYLRTLYDNHRDGAFGRFIPVLKKMPREFIALFFRIIRDVKYGGLGRSFAAYLIRNRSSLEDFYEELAKIAGAMG